MSNTFKNIMKSIGDSLDITNFIRAGHDYMLYMNLLHRPVGMVSKNYGFIRNTLFRNIGNSDHKHDGYGSVIGTLSDVEQNAWSKPPWFFIDEKKNNTSNYLEYINKTYFNDNGIENNFIDADTKMRTFNINSIDLENSEVGAIRGYSLNSISNNLYNDDLQTSPNSSTDTKLGILNNFYLNSTLYNSKKEQEKRIGKSITAQAYHNFGFDGEYGIENGHLHTISGRVATQSELIGDAIPWSTTDNVYDSKIVFGGGNKNIMGIQNIFKTRDKIDPERYNDLTKSSTPSNLYYPFGNFYSLTYSLGLIDFTNENTRNYILKSMYGYDLMDDRHTFNSVDDIPNDPPKKYYVGNGTRGTNYIDKLSGNDVNFIKYGDTIVRMQFPDIGNDNLWSARALYTYAEAEGATVPSTMGYNSNTFNEGIEYGKHVVYNQVITDEKKDIINYTNKRFQEGSYKTLISRFHTDEYESKTDARANRDITSTAISKYGMSHGRNLLKKDHEGAKDNGYTNPYCRTWTYHHQYHSLKDVIRPFDGLGIGEFKNTGVFAYRTTDGLDKLSKNGVKQSNGLVQIAPTSVDNIKKCMFSIENLAWKGEKDFFEGRADQKGPLGGRILWFPPYDLKFNESVSVNWNSNQFIGRGESIYTYTNTERSGTLSFKLLIDHPSIVNQWRGEVKGGDGIGDVDDVDSNEQQLLRFFAGCELLSVQKPEVEEEPKVTKIVPKVKDVELPVITYDELVFYVFYPNNYSGVDDDAEGVVKPMEYLINGVGANKYLNKNKKNLIEDYGTQLNERLYGYEMGNSNGISTKNVEKQTGITKTTPLLNIGDIDIAYQYCQSNKAGKPNYWGYRCDKAYENQVLHTHNGDTKINYYDIKDYGLNCTSGVENIVSVHTNDTEVYNKGRLFSFADVFCAIQPEAKKVLDDTIHYDEEQVKIISDILGINKESYSIIGIDVKGFASSHGYTASNDTLGKNRAKSVVKWLNKCYPSKFATDLLTYDVNEIGQKLSNYDSNSFLAKIWRCSRVAIKIQKEELSVKSELVDKPLTETDGRDNVTYKDNKTFTEITKARSLADMTKAMNKDVLKLAYVNVYGQSLSKVQEQSVINNIENNKAEADALAMQAKTDGNTLNISHNGKLGYGNEYKFFSELSSEEPFLHSKIVEKLKYFDPAFHSITPEGFQSRLTFLHQCTRQGSTAAASDSTNKRTANNLAFGRPPICVLRIGDFFNTKIIIESLNIDYDDTTWDLNDEGIGVMPMMANISISFKFLGGSDLTGPINRLQNALSFNHYANTSIYDNRAEEIEYDSEGNISKFKFKPE